MNVRKPLCSCCGKPFDRSRFHPKQTLCLSAECQRRRQCEYHRKKIATDDEYRQCCLDSQKKWRENNAGYQRRYRREHKAYSDQNRHKQLVRNQKRKLSMIVKNNLAIDVKRLPAKVWMTGPGLGEIVKNNLAISQVLIMETVAASKPAI
jgi:hypothetical protein